MLITENKDGNDASKADSSFVSLSFQVSNVKCLSERLTYKTELVGINLSSLFMIGILPSHVNLLHV